MTFRTRTFIGLAALVVIASLAVGQDQDESMIDNPQYAAWASFEVGAMAKIKAVSQAQGNQVAEMVVTETLTALDEQRAVITMQTTIIVADQEIEQEALEIEVPAQVPVPAEQPEIDAAPEIDVAPEIEQGEETVEVLAGTFDCQFTRTTMTMTVNGEELTSVTTVWTSDQVPGGQVKLVSVSQSQVGDQTFTRELVEYSAGG